MFTDNTCQELLCSDYKIHIECSNLELPEGLEWAERLPLK